MLKQHIGLPRALLRRRRQASDLCYAGIRGRAPRKLLSFATDIPVRSYLDHAFPLSIVSQDPKHHECLLSSFVQLFFPDDKLEYDRVLMLPSLRTVDWQQRGFLETLDMSTHSSALSRPEALVELLTDSLSQGYYAEIHIDEFFLPGRPCYRNTHSVHDNMIVGYDWPERKFHLAGYGSDYEVRLFHFEDILKAFYQMPRNQLARRLIRMVRLRDAKRSGFDLRGMVSQLRDYLESRVTVAPLEMRKARLYRKNRRFTGAWGLDAYSAFIEYIERMASQRQPLDLRATRTLWEHKACMLARLKYLEALDCFKDGRLFSYSYSPLEASAQSLRFQAYEYNACGLNQPDLDGAADELHAMREKERAVLSEVLPCLMDSPLMRQA